MTDTNAITSTTRAADAPAEILKRLNACVANINIGKQIEAELRRQKRTVVWLSRQLRCDRRNVYDIFQRTSIDCTLLMELSLILNTNFFEFYFRKVDEQLSAANRESANRQSLSKLASINNE